MTSVTVGFDEALDVGSATSPGHYTLDAAVKKRGKTSFTKPIAIGAIRYSDGDHSVMLILAKPFKGAVQLTVQAGILAAGGPASQVAFVQIVR